MLITQADNSEVERTSVFIQLSRITEYVDQLTEKKGKFSFNYYTGIDNLTFGKWEK